MNTPDLPTNIAIAVKQELNQKQTQKKRMPQLQYLIIARTAFRAGPLAIWSAIAGLLPPAIAFVRSELKEGEANRRRDPHRLAENRGFAESGPPGGFWLRTGHRPVSGDESGLNSSEAHLRQAPGQGQSGLPYHRHHGIGLKTVSWDQLSSSLEMWSIRAFSAIFESAEWRRDLTVPTGIFKMSAISRYFRS